MEAIILRKIIVRQRIVLEHFKHFFLECFNAYWWFLLELWLNHVKELRNATHHVGLVAVRGSEMNGFFVDGKQFFPVIHYLTA